MTALSYATTFDDLAVALRRVDDSVAFARARERMEASAKLRHRIDIKHGARVLLRERLWHHFGRLHIRGETPAAMLADCERRIADHRQLGRDGHYAFSAPTLVGLQQARLALRVLRRFGDRVAS